MFGGVVFFDMFMCFGGVLFVGEVDVVDGFELKECDIFYFGGVGVVVYFEYEFGNGFEFNWMFIFDVNDGVFVVIGEFG